MKILPLTTTINNRRKQIYANDGLIYMQGMGKGGQVQDGRQENAMDPPEKGGLLSVPHWQPSPFALPNSSSRHHHTPLTLRGQKYNLTATRQTYAGFSPTNGEGASGALTPSQQIFSAAWRDISDFDSEKRWLGRSGEIYLNILFYPQNTSCTGRHTVTKNRSRFTRTNHAMLRKHPDKWRTMFV